MRRGSYNLNHLGCFEGSAMKRLIICFMFALVLAACATDPVTPPPGNGGNNGSEPQACDDGSHGDITTAKPIEFGKAYQVPSGHSWFIIKDPVTPGQVTIRLDSLPNYGFFSYIVYETSVNGIIGDSFSDRDGTIPPSVVDTGEVDETNSVFVELEHIILDGKPCDTYQFMLTRD